MIEMRLKMSLMLVMFRDGMRMYVVVNVLMMFLMVLMV